MSCWLAIPIKAPAHCKLRLAGALGEDARRALVAAMLAHVVGEARAAAGIERVTLIGPSRHGLGEDIPLLADPGAGLNAALDAARAAALAAGVERLVLVSADLPFVTREELAGLAAATDIALATDRHGTGTNALSLPLPAAADFRFGYGGDSRARHEAEAARLGLRLAVVASAGLARDIDVPADLIEPPGTMGEHFA